MTETATVSVAEAAAATGFTRQAIYRAVKDGRLQRFLVRDDAGRARLMPEAVHAIRSGLLRLRVESATHRPPAPAPVAQEPEQPSGQDVADWANHLIYLPAWSAPPWPADRWQTLRVVIEEADKLAAEYGPFSEEIWQRLEEEGEV